MGLFNLYKPREYNYRYIYYDPEKEKQKEREKQAAGNENSGEYRPSIRRGTFREMADKNRNARVNEMRKANIRLIFIVLALLAVAYFLLFR